MKNYYTDKNYKLLLSQMYLLHQTNEKENKHILDVWDSKKVNHTARSMETGDYSFMIKSCPELGFLVDTYFTDELCIERKNSIDELAGCMKDLAFHNEIRRMQKIKNAYLLIENGTMQDIIDGNYRGGYDPKAFLNSIFRWQQEYGFHVWFVKKEEMARVIYEICRACLNREILKGGI